MPSPLLPLPQGRLYKATADAKSELHHNHSPLIPIPRTLTCLPPIHPPIIQGSLDSSHPKIPQSYYLTAGWSPRMPRSKFQISIKRAPGLALAYHEALLLCIFFHFHLDMTENVPFEKGETCHFFTQMVKIFFFLFPTWNITNKRTLHTTILSVFANLPGWPVRKSPLRLARKG